MSKIKRHNPPFLQVFWGYFAHRLEGKKLQKKFFKMLTTRARKNPFGILAISHRPEGSSPGKNYLVLAQERTKRGAARQSFFLLN